MTNWDILITSLEDRPILYRVWISPPSSRCINVIPSLTAIMKVVHFHNSTGDHSIIFFHQMLWVDVAFVPYNSRLMLKAIAIALPWCLTDFEGDGVSWSFMQVQTYNNELLAWLVRSCTWIVAHCLKGSIKLSDAQNCPIRCCRPWAILNGHLQCMLLRREDVSVVIHWIDYLQYSRLWKPET